jgi:hypothetical protein
MDLVSYTFLLTSIVNPCHILLKGGSQGFCHQTHLQINGTCFLELLVAAGLKKSPCTFVGSSGPWI